MPLAKEKVLFCFVFIQRQMWKMNKVIKIVFFWTKYDFLWIFKVCYTVGLKESIDYPKSTKSISIMVILSPKVDTTFSNMATRFHNMAMTWRNKKITFNDKFTLERWKCSMTVTNNSMTISQGIDYGHVQINLL